MNKYQLLSERLYKYFKYLRFITVIGLVLYLGVTAYNTHNDILSIISYFFMMLTLVCTIAVSYTHLKTTSSFKNSK